MLFFYVSLLFKSKTCIAQGRRKVLPQGLLTSYIPEFLQKLLKLACALWSETEICEVLTLSGFKYAS